MLGEVHDIDLKLLRVFRAIVRHGGFAAAQTELNASLPTISLQMKQLEERLGVRLCDRGHAGFRLTPQGEAVVQATERLFAGLDDFKNDIAELAKLPVGEVRLGVIDNLMTNPACRIHDAIARLHGKISGVGINFFVGAPSELESQVLGGTLDMAVGLFPFRHSALNYSTIFLEEHNLYCAREHPLFEKRDSEISVDDLLPSDYVSWSYLEPYVSAKTNLKLSPRTGTPFMDGVVCLILSGRYIGYLPRYFAQPFVESGQLRALLQDDLSRHIEVLLISRKSQRMKRVVAELYGALVNAHEGTHSPDRLDPAAERP